MSSILDMLRDQPVREFAAGQTIIEQGDQTGMLFFLVEGAVDVIKDGVRVATSSEPGAIFGDLSALLDTPHTAEVRATKPCRFHFVREARPFFRQNSELCIHLCELLARRLDAVNKYLVDVKQQFAGHDHLGMVDQVLDTLMHRQPRQRIAPRASTLRDPEILD